MMSFYGVQSGTASFNTNLGYIENATRYIGTRTYVNAYGEDKCSASITRNTYGAYVKAEYNYLIIGSNYGNRYSSNYTVALIY